MRTATLLAVALALSACGAGGDAATVAKVIEEDWNAAEATGARWPGHPELDGTTVERVDCAGEAEDGRVLRCTARLTSGARREIDVVARLDADGGILAWELEG